MNDNYYSILESLGYGKRGINIPVEYFPMHSDGTIDIEKTELICQQRIDSLGIMRDENGLGYVVEIKPNKTSKEIDSIIDALKRYKTLINPKEETPIHSVLTANKCPKCGANLGGKLIDDVFYENPYFKECPECGVRLKRLPWQH